MNCIIVGYGSIGQRHARVLKQLGCEVAVVSQRKIDFPKSYISLPMAVEKENPDYIIIANQTSLHYMTLSQIANQGFSGIVLIEKPLFHMNYHMPTNHFQKVYVAYNLRFHPIIQKIFSIVNNEKTLYAQIYVGQYLPNWRPNRDYRMNYSAKKNEGGGVLLDLSHELDYIRWFFGDWIRLTAVGGKYSALEIDSDDIFSLMLTMEKCPTVQMHVNYLDLIGRREITIITENYSIKADLMKQTLQINDDFSHFEQGLDDTYYLQHKAILDGDDHVLCSIDEGYAILEMIEAAEQAAKQGVWVEK